jgi:hypothetical protein
LRDVGGFARRLFVEPFPFHRILAQISCFGEQAPVYNLESLISLTVSHVPPF